MPDELPIDPVPASAPLDTSSTGGTSLAPNVAGMLAIIFLLVGGIVMLVVEKRNQFVRFWAMQSVFFGVAWFVFGFISAVLGAVLGAILGLLAWLWSVVSALVYLGLLAVYIIAIIKAYQGKEWEIPAIGKLARQQLAKLPPTV